VFQLCDNVCPFKRHPIKREIKNHPKEVLVFLGGPGRNWTRAWDADLISLDARC
jgi:hypothetical protein